MFLNEDKSQLIIRQKLVGAVMCVNFQGIVLAVFTLIITDKRWGSITLRVNADSGGRFPTMWTSRIHNIDKSRYRANG